MGNTASCPYCGKACLVRDMVHQSHWTNCGDEDCMQQAAADIMASEGRPGIRGLE